MGIKGLWKEVSPVCSSGHVSQFKGLRLGVDAYCWLHRAAVASVVAHARGRPCERFLTFFMGRVDLLRRCGITPVLIFDGCEMPLKDNTDAARHERRQQAKELGEQLLAQGRTDEAQRVLEKAVEITPELAHAAIRVAREHGVQCILAPFEADAQLAYLCKEGYIHGVVSEDSDLMVYNCALLVAKLDSAGTCDAVRLRDLPQLPQFSALTYELFVVACIMSGCDYAASLPGIGIRKATKLVAQHRSMDAALRALGQCGLVPRREWEQYEERVHKAFYCFAHHLVYDPAKRAVVPFNALPDGVPLRDDLIGACPAPDVAVAMCGECALNPHTGVAYTGDFDGSVQLYWQRVRGAGQATLSSLGVNTAGSADLGKAPQLQAPAVDPAAFAPRAKDRVRVRSKYFAPPAAVKVETVSAKRPREPISSNACTQESDATTDETPQHQAAIAVTQVSQPLPLSLPPDEPPSPRGIEATVEATAGATLLDPASQSTAASQAELLGAPSGSGDLSPSPPQELLCPADVRSIFGLSTPSAAVKEVMEASPAARETLSPAAASPPTPRTFQQFLEASKAATKAPPEDSRPTVSSAGPSPTLSAPVSVPTPPPAAVNNEDGAPLSAPSPAMARRPSLLEVRGRPASPLYTAPPLPALAAVSSNHSCPPPPPTPPSATFDRLVGSAALPRLPGSRTKQAFDSYLQRFGHK